MFISAEMCRLNMGENLRFEYSLVPSDVYSDNLLFALTEVKLCMLMGEGKP